MKTKNPQRSPEPGSQIQDHTCVVALAAWAIATYILGSCLLSRLYHCGFQQVHIFSPVNVSALAVMVSFLVFGAGFTMLVILPGWIVSLHFKKLKDDAAVFLSISFLLSLSIGILSTTLYKIIWPAGLNRINFLCVLTSLIVAGLVSLRRRSNHRQYISIKCRPALTRTIPYSALILLAVLFLLTFGHAIINGTPVAYQYDESVILSIPLGQQSDTLEVFGLAQSLKTHLLPYWDLEYADKFGFVFTDTPLYPYVALFAILLFGESLAALSLMSIGFIIMMFAAVLSQSRPGSKIRFWVCAALMLTYLSFLLKEPGVFVFVEHFFLLQVLLAYIFLLRKNDRVFLAFAATATLTRFYGIFFILIGLGALSIFFTEEQGRVRRLLYRYGFIVVSLLLFILLVGVRTGNAATYLKCILIEHFIRLDYFSFLSGIYPHEVVFRPVPALSQNVQFLMWTLYGTAFTFPAFFVFGDDREERFYSFISLVYFGLVFSSTYSLPRYVLPLIPLAATVFSSQWERYLRQPGYETGPNKDLSTDYAHHN